MQRHLVVAGVEFDEQVARLDGLVILYPDLHHRAGHAWADLMHVRGGVGIIGGNVLPGVEPKADPARDKDRQHGHFQDDAEGRQEEALALALLLLPALVLFPFLILSLVSRGVPVCWVALLRGEFVVLLEGDGDPAEALVKALAFPRRSLAVLLSACHHMVASRSVQRWGKLSLSDCASQYLLG